MKTLLKNLGLNSVSSWDFLTKLLITSRKKDSKFTNMYPLDLLKKSCHISFDEGRKAGKSFVNNNSKINSSKVRFLGDSSGSEHPYGVENYIKLNYI